MAIKEWPEDSRPREKLLQNGAENLADAELLALFIRTGSAGKTALDVSHQWLKLTGNLSALLALPWSKAKQLPGLGLARFAELQAAKELVRRAMRADLQRGDLVQSPHDASRLAEVHLKHQSQEILLLLSFNHQMRLLALDELARGNDHFINVYPRTVVGKAMERNAHSVILAHNHPSGCNQPSQADIQFTKQVSDALKLMQIQLRDHLLIADGPPVSMMERGLM